MTIKDELRAALEEILMERSTWSAPQVAPTQTQDQMVAGLAAPSPFIDPNMATSFAPQQRVDPLMVMQQNMQNLQALRSQESMQAQMTMQAFRQGMPGSRSPSSTMADPTFANYQLQNSYMMNPYMANYLGGQQPGGGGGGMNLAPAHYSTSANLGIFRDSSDFEAPGATSLGSLARDLITTDSMFSPFVRSYAAYEDPIDEKIAASRRLTRRKESAVATGLSAAAFAASFVPMVGIPAGLAIEGVAMAAGSLAESYYQRRAEGNLVQDVSRQFSSNSSSGGYRGVGFSAGQAQQLASTIRKEAAGSASYTASDYFQVLSEGADAGVFSFNSSPEATTSKLKNVIAQLDVFMKLSGDPDVQSAMQRMGQLQTLGLEVSQSQNFMTSMKAFARMAGTSVDTLMNTTGAYGAQIAAQTGAPAIIGMQVGAMSTGLIKSGQQTGAFTERELAAHGGVEGASQKATQMALNVLQSTIGHNVAAFTTIDGSGKFTIDQEALDAYTNTGLIPKGPDGRRSSTLAEASGKSMMGFGDNQSEFMAYQSRLTRDAMSMVDGPTKQLNFLRSRIKEEMRNNPTSTPKSILMRNFGDDWEVFDYMISEEAMMSQISQQDQATRTAVEGRRTKLASENTFLNRTGVAFNKAYEDIFGASNFMEARADKEQEQALRDSGMPYMRGLQGGNASLKGLGRYGVSPSIDSKSGVIDELIEDDATADYIAENYGYGMFAEFGDYLNGSSALGDLTSGAFTRDIGRFRGAAGKAAKGVPQTMINQAVRTNMQRLTEGGDYQPAVMKELGEDKVAELLSAFNKDPKYFGSNAIEALTSIQKIANVSQFAGSEARLTQTNAAMEKQADIFDVQTEDMAKINTLMESLEKVPGVKGMPRHAYTKFTGSILSGMDTMGSGDLKGIFNRAGLSYTDKIITDTLGAVRKTTLTPDARDNFSNSEANFGKGDALDSRNFMNKYLDHHNAQNAAVVRMKIQPLGTLATPEEAKLNEYYRETAEMMLKDGVIDKSFTDKVGVSRQTAIDKQADMLVNQERAAGLDLHNRGAGAVEANTRSTARGIGQLIALNKQILAKQ